MTVWTLSLDAVNILCFKSQFSVHLSLLNAAQPPDRNVCIVIYMYIMCIMIYIYMIYM